MLRKLMGLGMVCAAICATVAAAAEAGPTKRSMLKGRTGQGRVIRLEVRNNTVTIKRFSIELRCRNGTILVDEESGFLPSAVSGSGRVKDAQVGRTDEVLVRGQLKGRHLRGTIRVRDRLEGARCDSRWVRFHAGP